MKKTLSFFIAFFAIVNFTLAQIPQLQWSKNWNPFGGYAIANYFDLVVGEDGFYINGYTGNQSVAFSVVGKFNMQGDTVFKKLDTEVSTWNSAWGRLCVLEGKNKVIHISHLGSAYNMIANSKITGNFISSSPSSDVKIISYGDSIITISSGSGSSVNFLNENGVMSRNFPIGESTSGNISAKILNGNIWIFTGYSAGAFVAKYNLFTGQQMWRVNTLASVRSFGDIDSNGNAYLASSILVGGTHSKFQVKAVDANGSVLWTKESLPNGTVIANSQNFVNSVAVSTYKNLVVFGAEILRDSLTNNAGSSRSGYVMARSLSGDSIYAMRITDNSNYNYNQVQSVVFQNGCLVVLGRNWDASKSPQTIGWLKKYGDSLTGIEPNTETALKYSLSQNYPNPFNPKTNIRYSIPEKSAVKITVFDILGKEVQILVNEIKTKGNFSITFDGKNISSGIYFYRIETPEFTETKKMMLVK